MRQHPQSPAHRPIPSVRANTQSEGGFPELKVLKQRVRNLVQPDLDLGHSDIKKHQH